MKRLERFLSGLSSSGAILHILSLGHKEEIMESLVLFCCGAWKKHLPSSYRKRLD